MWARGRVCVCVVVGAAFFFQKVFFFVFSSSFQKFSKSLKR